MDQVEKVARAICIADGREPDGEDAMFICTPDNQPIPCWRGYTDQAEAAIAALAEKA